MEARKDFQAEVRRLRQENALLKQERDILKKAAALFGKEGGQAMSFALIDAENSPSGRCAVCWV